MTVIGNYKILKELGEGGCATTYLAEHIVLGEKACVKKNLKLSEKEEQALLQEARLLWHVHHHSLPTLRDVVRFDDDGSYLLIMTYIEGKDLYKLIKEDHPDGLDPEHVCWIMQRLLNALHYLHFYGIIHGDVKPQNIIVKPKEHNAVLVDFGLSTVRPKRISETPGYTPAFAAPEQVAGKPPIPETDLFGLGASMIFSLGGNFIGKTHPYSVPKPLQEFLNQCVRHDPKKRPKNASDLIAPLSDLREKLFGRRSSERKTL